MSDFLRLTRDEELLADLSVFGLDAADSKELETLIASRKEKDLSFEMAAAAMDLSMTKLTRLPDGLRGKILADGKEWVAALQKKGTSEPEAIVRPAEKEQPAEAELASAAVKPGRWSAEGQMVQAQSTSGRFLGRELIAWAAAAAIGFVAFFVWSSKSSETDNLNGKVADLTTQSQLLEIDLGKAREKVESALSVNAGVVFELEKAIAISEQLRREQKELESFNTQLVAKNREMETRLNPDGPMIYQAVAARDNIIRWEWADVDEAGVTGDVIWDPVKQEGAMRFVGLAENDPKVSQYQLWIIEENGRKHPVDGGVFDIGSGDAQSDGEVFKAINAKLVSGKPAAFAITVESPAGVVVSDRKKLPLLAQAPKE